MLLRVKKEKAATSHRSRQPGLPMNSGIMATCSHLRWAPSEEPRSLKIAAGEKLKPLQRGTSLRANLIDKCPSLVSKAKGGQRERGLASTQLRNAMDRQAGVIITRQ